MKGSPRIYFLWLNSNGGEEKKGSRSYRYPWNRKLWRKFFERRSKAPLSLSSVFGTLCARLLSARATGERYKSSSSFVRGGCRVDKCPFVNQRRYLSSLSLSLLVERSYLESDTGHLLLLSRLTWIIICAWEKCRSHDAAWYWILFLVYFIACNAINVIEKVLGRDLEGSIDFVWFFFNEIWPNFFILILLHLLLYSFRCIHTCMYSATDVGKIRFLLVVLSTSSARWCKLLELEDRFAFDGIDLHSFA